MTFEVASVKLNTTFATNSSINRANGGRLDCVNVSLRQLIQFAYRFNDYQILNAPGWVGIEHYDIVAKPSPEDEKLEPESEFGSETSSAGRLRARTRALLEDRFGLATHEENKEMSVYALVVANGGPKLEKTKTEIGPQNSWNNVRVICKKQTMKGFAETVLSNRFNRFVVDQTGLTDAYDFEMHFVPDPPAPKPGELPADSGGVTFEVALREQLGLKLITTKAPVPFLVIDKVSRPAEN